MNAHELAGKPVPNELLINVPRLVSAYYTGRPDAADPAQQVSFSTSGHRGSSLHNSFNEDHVLAICQAVCELRRARGITGPLYMGMDTHALSEPAQATALEVFAANDVDVVIQAGARATPPRRSSPTPFWPTTAARHPGCLTASSSPRRRTHRTMGASSTTRHPLGRLTLPSPRQSRTVPTRSC